jgi:hypothetical protein
MLRHNHQGGKMKPAIRALVGQIYWLVDHPDFDEALRSMDTGRNEALMLAASEHRISPEIEKVVARMVASTPHPPKYMDFWQTERALRNAHTTKAKDGSTTMDRPAFLASLREWCNQVGYPMPATPATTEE